ncbi:MAG: hypothetical protein Q8L52_00285 [bacterium]|nr:hypothetical protein [bacterium]
MGEIASQIKAANERIAKAVREIVDHGAMIDKLRKACTHVFRFHSQTNACHPDLWDVTYQCSECEIIATTKTSPVCEKCLCSLVRAKKNDRQATREAKKRGADKLLGNPPLAFRCPECGKIHILWHEGD